MRPAIDCDFERNGISRGWHLVRRRCKRRESAVCAALQRLSQRRIRRQRRRARAIADRIDGPNGRRRATVLLYRGAARFEAHLGCGNLAAFSCRTDRARAGHIDADCRSGVNRARQSDRLFSKHRRPGDACARRPRPFRRAACNRRIGAWMLLAVCITSLRNLCRRRLRRPPRATTPRSWRSRRTPPCRCRRISYRHLRLRTFRARAKMAGSHRTAIFSSRKCAAGGSRSCIPRPTDRAPPQPMSIYKD